MRPDNRANDELRPVEIITGYLAHAEGSAFIKTGNTNPDGSAERIALPTYAKDWFAYSKDPIATISHKLHPMWSSLAEMFQNEDFYGTEIRGKDDPIVKQSLDIATHIGKQFLHFLETEANEADDLYLLGDLFEAWVGDDDPNTH